ncbi:unnamed protein product [Prunus armeniaca]|uniref:Uncharacterized protein n=1 Tax=Prunus armeniaca TaxID=36596 RepID=A0A6J5X1W2_PRUAR|nr:unnamed protein product [Prunus armeniaca]
MEDGNPDGDLKMVAMKKGSFHGQREGDGERGKLGDLNGVTEMVTKASSVDGAREICFIDVRKGFLKGRDIVQCLREHGVSEKLRARELKSSILFSAS